jgi:hypothetical protein
MLLPLLANLGIRSNSFLVTRINDKIPVLTVFDQWLSGGGKPISAAHVHKQVPHHIAKVFTKLGGPHHLGT